MARAGRALRRRGGGLALGVAALLSLGCPEPEPEPEPCAGQGDPVLRLANRGGDRELVDGDEVEVFPPPQGGVFTELDATVENLDIESLEFLRVDVVTTVGAPVASARFFGDSVPLRCTEDEVYVLDNLPVAFFDAVELDSLDGVSVVITGRLEMTDDFYDSTYEVVLRVTDY